VRAASGAWSGWSASGRGSGCARRDHCRVCAAGSGLTRVAAAMWPAVGACGKYQVATLQQNAFSLGGFRLVVWSTPMPYLIYRPDKNAAFGHAPRKRRVRAFWTDVQRFLAACTLPEAATAIQLIAYRATKWDDESIAEACIARARQHFGVPEQDIGSGGAAWPSEEPTLGGHLSWSGTPDRLEEMLAFVAEGEPWPKQTLGPIDLRVRYYFRWRDPHTGDVLRSQPESWSIPKSSLSLTLGRRCFVQPDLAIPYAPGDPMTQVILKAAVPFLPFSLQDRHFRVIDADGDPSPGRSVKLARSPLDAA
jgi:hypothetical protein